MARRRYQALGELILAGNFYYVRYRASETDPNTGKRPKIYHQLGEASLGKKEIERRRRDFMASRDPWLIRPNSSRTFSDFLKRFELDAYPMMKPEGLKHYTYHLTKNILPVIGHLKLREITRMHLQNVVTVMVRKKLSWQSIKHAQNVARAVFKHAKRMQEWVGDLPTEDLMLPERAVKHRRALTWEQVMRIVRIAPEPVSTMILVLTLTGLRIGELLGLKWKYLHGGETPFIEVAETYGRGRWKPTPKNKKTRFVPIAPWLYQRLTERKKLDSSPDDPIFMSDTGRPLDAANYRMDYLQPAAAKAGIWPMKRKYHSISHRSRKEKTLEMDSSAVDWHTFRHTWATLADQAGLSEAQQMLILGHATSQITKRYTHPEMDPIRLKMENFPTIN